MEKILLFDVLINCGISDLMLSIEPLTYEKEKKKNVVS